MNTTDILKQLGWSEELIKAVEPALMEPAASSPETFTDICTAEDIWVHPSEPVLVSGISYPA